MVGELVRKMAGQLGAQRVDEMGADLVALSVVLLAVDLVDDLAGETVERKEHEKVVLWAVLKVQ